MTKSLDWQQAADEVAKQADGQQNRLAIASVCEHIANSPMAEEFTVDISHLPNQIFIRKANGAFPSKRLKLESITEDRVEICFSDTSPMSERYYVPHTQSSAAKARALDILKNLDWSSPALQCRNLREKITWYLGGETPNN